MTLAAAAPFATGIGLALAVGLFATVVGFDRERSFYATVLIVVASFYALFAILASSTAALAWELPGLLLFGAASVLGFRNSLWILVAGLAGHGLFDAVHGHVISNPGTPSWWPAFCASYDIAAAAYLAARIGNVRFAPAETTGQ